MAGQKICQLPETLLVGLSRLQWSHWKSITGNYHKTVYDSALLSLGHLLSYLHTVPGGILLCFKLARVQCEEEYVHHCTAKIAPCQNY